MPLPRILLVAPALFFLAGCLGNYNGDPEARGSRSVEERTRTDLAEPVLWRRAYLGAGKREKLLGYVKSKRHGEGTRGATNFLYDTNFNLIARVSPRGELTRIDPRGRETWKGNFTLKLAILTAFDYTSLKTIVLKPMQDPRG